MCSGHRRPPPAIDPRTGCLTRSCFPCGRPCSLADGDPKTIGKIGTDIQDNKCGWLIVQALERATPVRIARQAPLAASTLSSHSHPTPMHTHAHPYPPTQHHHHHHQPHHQPPTTNHQPPTTNHHPPSTIHQPPTTNHHRGTRRGATPRTPRATWSTGARALITPRLSSVLSRSAVRT